MTASTRVGCATPLAFAAARTPSTAASIILRPPEAWTVSRLTPSIPACVRGGADRIRNIVELEIEKDLFTRGHQIAGHHRTLRREDLRAHLEHPHVAVELLRNLQCGLGARDIQRHNDLFFCRHSRHFSGTTRKS